MYFLKTDFIVILLILCLSSCQKEVRRHGFDLDSFVVGKYQLIGKQPQSGRAYAGRIEIAKSGQTLVVERVIDGRRIRGTARIEAALAEQDVRLLKMYFVQAGKKYEESCMIDSDMDNYARITCFMYSPGIQSDKPGLEALFVVPDP